MQIKVNYWLSYFSPEKATSIASFTRGGFYIEQYRTLLLLSCLCLYRWGLHLLSNWLLQSSSSWSSKALRFSSSVCFRCCVLFDCFPLSSLFARYVHLTGMISLSLERGLLWLKHDAFQSWALHFEPTPFFGPLLHINWWVKCLFSFSQDCSLHPGSLALEALLIGVNSFNG